MIAAGETLRGRRITLAPFGVEDVSARYLGWLADPEVNRYSRRRLEPAQTREQAVAFLDSLDAEEQVLAIRMEPHGHVGNIKFGPIDRINRRADISILIGERAVWGLGVARETIHVLGIHLLREVGLHRIDAGTCNPAFIRAVTAIGWQVEGTLRDRIWLGDRFHDQTLMALLARDVPSRPDLEFSGAGR